NEVEALILESTLIKRHHPWYNVRLADDKAYPYLKLTNDPFPKIVMTRKVARDGGKYFGPYPYHELKLVGRTIRLIRRLFKLRTCNLEIAGDLPRPCLDYYIGQCSAPCVAWGGRVVGQEHFMLRGTRGVAAAETLRAFLPQYYETASAVPPEILLPEPVPDAEVIEQWLAERRGGRVALATPQRGERVRLVAMARENAALHLAEEKARVGDAAGPGVRDLQHLLRLEAPAVRIECYDTSNFRGCECVAWLVVAEGGRPKKSDYRRFRMKYAEGPDDTAMMQEVLRGRLAQARREQGRFA